MNREVFKIGNEIVAFLPDLFDAGFDFTKVLLTQLNKFALEKGFTLDHIDVVFRLSYDLNKNPTNHKMEGYNSFTIYEDEGKYHAFFETTSVLKYGDLWA